MLGFVTDKFALVPNLKIKKELLEQALEVEIHRAEVNSSPLLGIYLAGNSTATIAPYLMRDEEVRRLSEIGIPLHRFKTKLTAWGNLLLVNDYGCIASPLLSEKDMEEVRKALNVPLRKATIAGEVTVGSLAVATNRGVLAHPGLTKEEAKIIEETLGVPVSVGTACRGVGYVGLCMLSNSKGVLVGDGTTGAELGRIEAALGFV